MKKQLLMLGILFLPTLAMAAAPDFSGSWAKDTANSDPVPDQAYWMTRVAPAAPRPGGGAQRGPQVTLAIHQEGKTLHVVDSQNSIHDYTLDVDGSPHTKAMDTAIEKAVVTAAFQGDNTLEVDTTEPYGGMPGNAKLTVKEVWVLSPDGKTLTVTTTRAVAARQQTYKVVYNRAQAQPMSICSDGCVVPK